MKKLLLSAAIVLLPVMSVQAANEEIALFNQLDADKNGLVSQEEAKTHPDLGVLFNELDADEDGQLSTQEFKALIK
ncbi:EF-hand domain-containing protein [Gammaproteobacteria bacterium AS21]|jgi:Ca2+-binding EF-hand superfamily protein